MSRTTVATINKLMKANGIQATMYRGNGYYYFMPHIDNFQIHSIYTNCISNWKPEDIMDEIRENTEVFG
jgi:hypothetical protein